MVYYLILIIIYLNNLYFEIKNNNCIHALNIKRQAL